MSPPMSRVVTPAAATIQQILEEIVASAGVLRRLVEHARTRSDPVNLARTLWVAPGSSVREPLPSVFLRRHRVSFDHGARRRQGYPRYARRLRRP
jgi:hypothetical protein